MKNLIYVVQPRDSLYTISRRFGVTSDEIKKINNLESNILYVGQKIEIPSAYYIVQPGDSLYSIAIRLNTIIDSIIKLNGLSTPILMVGERLQIPLYSEVVVTSAVANVRSNPAINAPIIAEVGVGAKLPVVSFRSGWYGVKLHNGKKGWISSSIVRLEVYGNNKPIVTNLGFYTLEEGVSLPSSYESFINNRKSISEIGLFLFRIDSKNPIAIERFGSFTDQYINNIVANCHNRNIRVLPVLHNLLYEKGDVTSAKDLIKQMTFTRENRQILIQNIIKLIERFNFDGVNIDIEDVYLEDKDNLSKFYRELGDALYKKGYFLSASVPSRISDKPFNPFSDPFDYEAIGASVDEFVVMLYNEHGWPGSGPGPVVSIGWMEKVLSYAITKMPKEKIVAAVSVFGFDFNLTTGKNTYVTYNMAMDLAKEYNKQVIFDDKTKTPMFSYVDKKGDKHEVWFENAESIYYKIQLAWNFGIKGIGLWRLGMEDPNIWTMIENDVVIRKA